jgi:hypothetical protein
MKKILLLLAILAMPALAGFTEYGAHGGFMIPSGDSTDVYKGSLFLGAQLLSHMPMFAIEASISYVFLGFDDDGIDASGHMIPILAGVRSYSGPMFFGGGLGLHLISTEVAGVDTSTSDIGGYLNAGMILPTASTDIEISAKYHIIDFSFDKAWFALGVGAYF